MVGSKAHFRQVVVESVILSVVETASIVHDFVWAWFIYRIVAKYRWELGSKKSLGSLVKALAPAGLIDAKNVSHVTDQAFTPVVLLAATIRLLIPRSTWLVPTVSVGSGGSQPQVFGPWKETYGPSPGGSSSVPSPCPSPGSTSP